MNAQLKEARYSELLQKRSMTQALIKNAERVMGEMINVNRAEYLWWKQRREDLVLELGVDNACMRAVLSQEDKDRYADEREQARREDHECVGATDGSVNWEAV